MAWAYNTPDGTPNNGPTIAAVALTVTSLALIALCLRIYVRTRISKAVGLGTYLKGAPATIVIAASLSALLEDPGRAEANGRNTDDWLIIASWVCCRLNHAFSIISLG